MSTRNFLSDSAHAMIYDVYDMNGRNIARGPLLTMRNGTRWVPGDRSKRATTGAGCYYETVVIRPYHKLQLAGDGGNETRCQS